MNIIPLNNDDYQLPEIDMSDLTCDLVYSLTSEELQFIADKTESNRHLEHHDVNYFEEKMKNGVFLLRKNGKLLGFIFEHNYVYNGIKIAERGTLWVSREIGGRNLGAFLMKKMTEKIQHKPIMSVTNNPFVQRVNEAIMNFEVLNPEGNFRTLVEEGGPIYDDYRIFVNDKMSEIMGM